MHNRFPTNYALFTQCAYSSWRFFSPRTIIRNRRSPGTQKYLLHELCKKPTFQTKDKMYKYRHMSKNELVQSNMHDTFLNHVGFCGSLSDVKNDDADGVVENAATGL